MRTYPVKKGEVREFQVESLAFGGNGVAKVDGYTVFIGGGLPGQTVEAMVIRRKKNHGEARLLRVLQPSPDQVEPRCRHFGVCGGCRLQHLDLAAQRRAKREQVHDCLVRLGGLKDIEVAPTLASPGDYEYRNKMEFSFATRWLTEEELAGGDAGERFGLGLHVRGRYDRVVNIYRCHLQDEPTSKLLRAARASAQASGQPAYSTRTHEGFWRFLVIRRGENTGDRMVLIITHQTPSGGERERAVREMAQSLAGTGVPITSLLHGVSTRKGSVAYCESVEVLKGAPHIEDTLLDFTFEIGPHTFFQTNTRAAEVLFTQALDRAELRKTDVAWDLYCGAGAFTLPLARQAARVVGAELVPQAVEAARRNAAANGVDNATFLAGDLRELIRTAALRPEDRPDVVAVDPPREGMHEEVVRALLAAAPERIVYISCNPATLARDAGLLVAGGYRPGPVQPVDLFPHTAHIESVMGFRREG